MNKPALPFENQHAELMRVFRDLNLVEQLGSGIPRILVHYPKSVYEFSLNFTRVVLPFSKVATTEQATEQAERLLAYCKKPRASKDMMIFLGVTHRPHFRESLLIPLLDSGQLQMTLPDIPKSPKQRYVATGLLKRDETD